MTTTQHHKRFEIRCVRVWTLPHTCCSTSCQQLTQRHGMMSSRDTNEQEKSMTMYWVNVYEMIADEAGYLTVAEFQGSQGLFDNEFDAAKFCDTVPGSSTQGFTTRLGDQHVLVKVEHKRGSDHMVALSHQPHAQENAA